MGRLPEAWLQELYARTDLRELIGSYVALTEKGGRLWGCCPFHHEQDPSFTVNLQQGFYHCFGCGKHGNAVGFVMEMERLGFREACEFLASRVGLELPQDDDDDRGQHSRAFARRLREMNRAAASFFHRCLSSPASADAAAYLRRRGIPPAIQTKYGLGYAPDGWHALRDHLASAGFTGREMREGGLVQEKNGSRYDIFRNRIIFPIVSAQSEVIGFGGRVLDDSVPKYLNSPATPVFNKSHSLFNMNTVMELRRQGRLPQLILMEGYMDVVAAACHGVYNTCATLGTALTKEQCQLIKRFTGSVCVCYDGDAAGVKAALRALDLLAEADLPARVVYLPDGMDPDEYLRAEGRGAYEKQVQNALEPMAFRFRIARGETDPADPAERARYAEKCVELLRAEKSALVREQYARILHQETGFRLDAILEDIGGPAAPAQPAPAAAATGRADVRAENFVTAVLAGRPDLGAALVVILNEGDFENPVNAAVFRYVRSNSGRGAEVSADELLDMLEDDRAQRHLRWLLAGLSRYDGDDAGLKSMLTSSVARLGMRRTRREMQTLQAELSGIRDPEQITRKRRRIQKLGHQLQAWKQHLCT